MFSATCPKCRKPVSLPAGVDPDVWVRCPLCLAKFQLQAVLAKLPPLLEVVDAPEEAEFASLMDQSSEPETAFAAPAEEPPISSAAFAAVSEASNGAMARSAAFDAMELGEDEDTLPAMEAGSLAPSGGLADYHETHGFREAPDDEGDSGVLELQGEAGEWQAPPVATAEPAVGVAASTVRRRKKSNRNPVVEVLKIVVGGGMGVVIGYAILMWGFKVDPLKLAEILPPAIVPNSLQPPYRSLAQNNSALPLPQQNSTDPWGGAASESEATEPEPEPLPMNEPPSNEPPVNEPPMNESPVNNPPTAGSPMPPLPMPPTPDASNATPPMPSGEPPLPTPEPTPNPQPSDPPANNPPSADSNSPSAPKPEPKSEPQPAPPDATAPTPPMTDPPQPPPTETPAPMPMPEPANPTEKSATTAPLPTPEPPGFPPVPAPLPPQEEPAVGPKSNTKFSLDQVNQAMKSASENAKSFTSAAADLPEAERTKLKINMYRSFADLAEAITLLADKTDNTKAARAAALALLQTYANEMPKLNQIGKLAGIWRKSSFRKGSGIILAGRVQETTPVGKLFRTRLLMLGHDQPSDAEILIVTADDPQIEHGEIAVMLGTIVGAPAINLHDYEGTEDSIIWASAIGPVQIDALAP